MSHVVQLLHLASVEARLSVLRDRLAYSPKVLLLEFCALALFTLLAMAGRRWAAVAVLPFAAAWPFLNQMVEGPTLVVLSYNHGITLMDLLSLVAVLAAAWAFFGARRTPARAGFAGDGPRDR